MSFSNNVAEFMHVLGPFYEAVYEGQEPDHLPGVRRSSSSSRTSSRSHSEADKEQLLEDESGYSSSINGTGNEENGESGTCSGNPHGGGRAPGLAQPVAHLPSTCRPMSLGQGRRKGGQVIGRFSSIM